MIKIFLKHYFIFIATVLLFLPANVYAGEYVLTTIRPIELIITELTKGTDIEVKRLIPPNVSQHTAPLKPSVLAKIQAAKLVFAISPSFELNLGKVLKSIKDRTVFATDSEINFVSVETDHGHDHDNDHEEDESLVDLHFWVSPAMAANYADFATEKLADRFESNALKIKSNGQRFKNEMNQLNQEFRTLFDSMTLKSGIITIHRSTRYFELQYGIKGLVELGHNPKTRTLANLKSKSAQKRIQCYFVEPQYDREMTESKYRILDPDLLKKRISLDTLGVQPAINFSDLLRDIADSFYKCLQKNN